MDAPGLLALVNTLDLDEKTQPRPRIRFLQLRRGICLGTCPVYSVDVFTNGDVEYHGELNVTTVGRASAHLSPDALRTLRRALVEADFASHPRSSRL